jgi:hypothetical protein
MAGNLGSNAISTSSDNGHTAFEIVFDVVHSASADKSINITSAEAGRFEIRTAQLYFCEHIFITKMFAIGVDIVHDSVDLKVSDHQNSVDEVKRSPPASPACVHHFPSAFQVESFRAQTGSLVPGRRCSDLINIGRDCDGPLS